MRGHPLPSNRRRYRARDGLYYYGYFGSPDHMEDAEREYLGETMKVGDKIQLHRRYSEINGWSCRPDLDRKIVEVLEVEDRPNGGIVIRLPEGGEGYIFRDAVGTVIPSP